MCFIPQPSSGKVVLHIDRLLFTDMGSLVSYHGDTGIFIIVIFIVFTAVIDEKILLLVNEFQDVSSAGLEIRC